MDSDSLINFPSTFGTNQISESPQKKLRQGATSPTVVAVTRSQEEQIRESTLSSSVSCGTSIVCSSQMALPELTLTNDRTKVPSLVVETSPKVQLSGNSQVSDGNPTVGSDQAIYSESDGHEPPSEEEVVPNSLEEGDLDRGRPSGTDTDDDEEVVPNSQSYTVDSFQVGPANQVDYSMETVSEMWVSPDTSVRVDSSDQCDRADERGKQASPDQEEDTRTLDATQVYAPALVEGHTEAGGIHDAENGMEFSGEVGLEPTRRLDLSDIEVAPLPDNRRGFGHDAGAKVSTGSQEVLGAYVASPLQTFADEERELLTQHSRLALSVKTSESSQPKENSDLGNESSKDVEESRQSIEDVVSQITDDVSGKQHDETKIAVQTWRTSVLHDRSNLRQHDASQTTVRILTSTPPTSEYLKKSLGKHGLSDTVHVEPYYSELSHLRDLCSKKDGHHHNLSPADLPGPPSDVRFLRDAIEPHLLIDDRKNSESRPSDEVQLPGAILDGPAQYRYILAPTKDPPDPQTIFQQLQTFKERAVEGCSEPMIVEEGKGSSNSDFKEEEADEDDDWRPPSPKYNEGHLVLKGTNSRQSIDRAQFKSPDNKKSLDRLFGFKSPQGSDSAAPSSGALAASALEQGQSPVRLMQDDAMASNVHAWQQLTVMSVEVLSCQRGYQLPDPKYDPVCAIVYCVHEDYSEADVAVLSSGILLFPGSTTAAFKLGVASDVQVHVFQKEEALISAFIALTRDVDPDVLVGWEIQRSSLGYLFARCAVLSIDIEQQLSRILQPNTRCPQDAPGATAADNTSGDSTNLFVRNRNASAKDASAVYRKRKSSGIQLTGRITLNLWRLMRSELKLNPYTLENVALHVLGRRIPYFSNQTLSTWFRQSARAHQSGSRPLGAAHRDSGSGMWRCLQYYLIKVQLNIQIMDQLDFIGRTSELARVFGITFFNVLFRGSQYRVESMLLRLAKSQNYLLNHLSPKQVAAQPAMECMPLVMEPMSKVYTSPVVVLDFQSLYPSMIIGYNICYSTCLGKVPGPSQAESTGAARHQATSKQDRGVQRSREPGRGSDDSDSDADLSQESMVLDLSAPGQEPSEKVGTAARHSRSHRETALGGTAFNRSMWHIKELEEKGLIWISPNGVMFAKPQAKKGVLPRLLAEILETRVMVKRTMKMKHVKDNKALSRILNSRQFALKLIANVTYGYTSAGFSGRMPCAEIADSIVQTGRETLEAAIRMVEKEPKWGAKVVYGDTDSLFVLLEGKSKEQAFEIGKQIAERVTKSNPKPVRLQMEKVYLPCALVSKKRYVGYMFESPAQTEATFDAKGIETVRRDSCPIVQKVMEKSIRVLFETKDLSRVRSYLERQWTKILAGQVSLEKFVFSKEVKIGRYSANGVLPPAAVVASHAMTIDRRAEPLYNERIPYVVIDGPARARLVDLVVHPQAVLEAPAEKRVNANYYIIKQILPALKRIFDLVRDRSGGRVDIETWYSHMPRPKRKVNPLAGLPAHSWYFRVSRPTDEEDGTHKRPPSKQRTMDQFCRSKNCLVCGEQVAGEDPFCQACTADTSWFTFEMYSRLNDCGERYSRLVQECVRCIQKVGLGFSSCQAVSISPFLLAAGAATDSEAHQGSHRRQQEQQQQLQQVGSGVYKGGRPVVRDIECDSLDCPNLFARIRASDQLRLIQMQVHTMKSSMEL